MKKIMPLFFTILLLLSLPLSALAAPLDEVKMYVENYYVGDIEGDLQSATTIDEVIEMLDPYSAYFTREEYDAYINSINSTTVGIGIVIEKHEKGILILDVIDNGSAINYGIEDGDIIISVNGQSTVDMTLEQASSLITGKNGTSVSIQLLKKNGSIVTKTVVRKPFSLENVESEKLYGDVGYILLNSFTSEGAREVKDAYEQLKSQGATSFIVDLQNNGGGYVSTAEELIGMFPGATYAYRLQEAARNYIVKSVYQPVQFPKNTRLLVNRFSASASEMTAVSLLDQSAAILYGEQTYGKGTMQGFYSLSDGSILKLTIGEFFGPNYTLVKNVGVTPHIQTNTNPLFHAHYDSIVEKLSGYNELNSLLNVPTTKTFTVAFNKTINQVIDESAVHLVELGGNTVDVSLSSNDNKLIVTPTEPLTPGAEYMLIVHPKVKDELGKVMNKGYFLKITVQG